MTDINATLRKLKALADGTMFEGERDAALRKLHRLMEKHGVTEEALCDKAETTCEFKFRSRRERTLLQQILYKVFGNANWSQYGYTRGGKKVSGTVGVDCTAAQKIEIDMLYDFYKQQYRKEEEAFFLAFVYKHELFGPPKDEDDESLSLEELEKLRQMMKSMDDAIPHRQIEEGSAKR